VAAGLSSPEAQRRIGQPATQARPQPGVTSRTAHLEMAFPAVLTAAVLAGFVLRLLLLDRFPLREDEAIYAYWARYGREVDWRFLQVWPDKPPLFIAALALAFETWGASPAAARFVNIAAQRAHHSRGRRDGAALVGAGRGDSRCAGAHLFPLCHQLRLHRLHRPTAGAHWQPRPLRRRLSSPLLGWPVARRRNHDQAAGVPVCPAGRRLQPLRAAHAR
jgi:hypothetical protein